MRRATATRCPEILAFMELFVGLSPAALQDVWWVASLDVVEIRPCAGVVGWPSDRLAKVELRHFNLTPRGPDDR
ncbi:MAG: hypothetical protein M3Y22_17425, partial [Pseudomonadota bacterium]|nr:hypothetical protein [Pseudomonadota bacterium]